MDKYPLFCYVLTNMKVGTRIRQTKRLFSCPVEAAQDVIGGKWKPIILWHLHAAKGPCRFGILRRAIPKATGKKIVEQIRELEAAGIIYRRGFWGGTPGGENLPTENGENLKAAFRGVWGWGGRKAK